MPKRSTGPYLYYRKRKGKTPSYVIRDKQKEIATGCGLGEIGIAERKLAAYIESKWEPEVRRNSSVGCEAVIMTYCTYALPLKSSVHRQNELLAQCKRLLAFWGGKALSAVIGSTCREYAAQSTTPSMARHDLEIMRAATNHYKREYGLDSVPTFTLPPKGAPRPDYMTRSMAAKLLWSAHRRKAKHLVRYLLISYYTGTRSGAVFDLQWFPNTTGGYVDIERSLMYRAPEGEGLEGNKRKPPLRIPNKLLPWLKRWRENDTANGGTIRNIVHYKGKRIKSVKRAFRRAVTEAGLPDWVIPHLLRHSAITWDMQAGKNINHVAEKYGLTVKVLEQTYWHHSPDYQKELRG